MFRKACDGCLIDYPPVPEPRECPGGVEAELTSHCPATDLSVLAPTVTVGVDTDGDSIDDVICSFRVSLQDVDGNGRVERCGVDTLRLIPDRVQLLRGGSSATVLRFDRADLMNAGRRAFRLLQGTHV